MTRYRIIFCGIHGDESAFSQRLVSMGVSREALLPMVEKAPLEIKRGLTQDQADLYARKLQEAGGLVAIQKYKVQRQDNGGRKPQAVAPFNHFTLCPECGLKQTKGRSCIRCGFKLRNAGKGLESERVKGS